MPPHSPRLACLGLLPLVWTTPVNAQPPAKGVADAGGRLLARLPAEVDLAKTRIYVDHTGRRLVYVTDGSGGTEGKDRNRVVVEAGKVIASHPVIDGVSFSRDGRHLAFRAMSLNKKKEERWTIYLDGRQRKSYRWVSRPGFTPSGQPIYWVRTKKPRNPNLGQYRLVTGTSKSVAYQGIQKDEPWTFHARTSKPVFAGVYKNQWRAQLGDSRLVQLPPRTTMVAISANGTNILRADAFWGLAQGPGKTPKKPESYRLFCGSRKLLYADDMSMPVVSPTGETCLVLHDRGLEVMSCKSSDPVKKSRILCDGSQRPVFSPDGKHWAALVTSFSFERGSPRVGSIKVNLNPVTARWSKGKPDHTWLWRLVVDGNRRKRLWDYATDAVIGGTGRVVAFRGRNDESWYLAVKGKRRGPAFDDVGRPVISHDESRVSFWARKGREVRWEIRELR